MLHLARILSAIGPVQRDFRLLPGLPSSVTSLSQQPRFFTFDMGAHLTLGRICQ